VKYKREKSAYDRSRNAGDDECRGRGAPLTGAFQTISLSIDDEAVKLLEEDPNGHVEANFLSLVSPLYDKADQLDSVLEFGKVSSR
jgi:hypothetical protein